MMSTITSKISCFFFFHYFWSLIIFITHQTMSDVTEQESYWIMYFTLSIFIPARCIFHVTFHSALLYLETAANQKVLSVSNCRSTFCILTCGEGVDVLLFCRCSLLFFLCQELHKYDVLFFYCRKKKNKFYFNSNEMRIARLQFIVFLQNYLIV